ncbi:MAG: helix-turn-helix transcriptional regulator [Bacilli bacterium]|nr:helix-turn-helix transcriptional regulator [Bacilli bacterium]
MNLKDNLKRIRKENNLSQEQLADKLNVSRQSVSKWESGVSYPEMDKMILICKMFDLSMDELLNQNVKAVNDEKKNKVEINKYIDSFLNFISKSYDMLNSMTRTQIIRCIFEQLFFMLVFYCISMLVVRVVDGLFGNILDVFNYYDILKKVFDLIIVFLKTGFLILDFILVVYIYKIRYLDYYLKDDKKEEIKKEENNKPEKIERVIIRDPKHSEYRFISGLLRLLTIFTKCFITLILLFAVFILLTLLVFLVLSFMFVKTGLLFVGGFIVLLSSIIVLLVFMSSLYCFIINRKYNYRFMERTLLISIITLGLGLGISFLSITNFEFKNDKVEEEIVIPMNENLNYSWNVSYVEEDRADLRIVATHSKYYKLKYDSDMNVIYNDYINEDRYDEFRNIIKDINNKKIIDYRTDYITIYTSKDNIDKLMNYNQ